MDWGKWFDRLIQVIVAVCAVATLWYTYLAYQDAHQPAAAPASPSLVSSFSPYLPYLWAVSVTSLAVLVYRTFFGRPRVKAEHIDWILWKKFPTYTVRELPRILAKNNPVSDSLSDRAKTIQRMIFASMKDGTLPYIKVESESMHYDYKLPDFDTRIARQDALFWARHNGIDVSHVDG